MKPHSLRSRLMLLAGLALLAGLTVAGASLVIIFERHMERRVEQELHVRLTELATALALTEDGTPSTMRPLSDPRYNQPFSGSYWQIADETGPVHRSRSLWEETLPAGTAQTAGPGAAAFEEVGPAGSTLYVLQRDVLFEDTNGQKAYRLSVALDHADIEELGSSFRRDVVLALGCLAAVLLGGAWVQTTFGLSPLRHLRRQLAEVRNGQEKRVGGELPVEVRPLVDDLNHLLDKQDEMIAKARKRAGDLAHGLKTPLTVLIGEARRLEDCGALESARTLREQVELMRGHVERELARARTHGVTAAGGMLTDVSSSLQRVLALMRRMPRGDALEWQVDVPAELKVLMDPADFGEVIGNLLDNARKFARTSVTVEARVGIRTARISVLDDGEGVDAVERARMVQRGEQIAYDTQGSGLGLAIVSDVLGEYGSKLEIGDGPGGGTRISFVATVPSARAAASRRTRDTDQGNAPERRAAVAPEGTTSS